MDATKKARWKERDARRKLKRRHRAIERAHITLYPIPDSQGNLGTYTWGRLSTPTARSTAPLAVIAKYNETIASSEYQQAISDTRSPSDLQAVMRRYGTLHPPR